MREAAGTTKNLRDLAGWAASTGADAIPRSVLERGARVLVDDLAAIVGARDEPEVQRFHARLCAAPTREESTLFRGGRSRLDRFTAAVGNATAGDFLELDEGYRAAPCHAGLYVVPALIAHAETFDLPLREMLRALVVAYEIVTRVARTWPPREMNLHSHARYCAVGAAAATALASGADASLLMRALTCAATLVNTGPRNHLITRHFRRVSRHLWLCIEIATEGEY